MAQSYRILVLIFISVCATAAAQKSESAVAGAVSYTGICGASAGAAIGSNLFIVGDDESSRLRIYRRNQDGPAIATIDLAPELDLDRRAPEIDLEGAARIGDLAYWITSHSRNKKGKEHPNRYRFFATSLVETNGQAKVSFLGRPYKNLLRDLASSPMLRPFHLQAASRLAPKEDGALNIEGLCATPNGHLLIAFRNPIPNGRALLVPLLNPETIISGTPARFGPAIQLDLNGLGIRDMAYWNGDYLIIAGSHDGRGKSRLYQWSGTAAPPKHLKDVNFKGLNPEALIIYPNTGLSDVQILSDDSSRGSVDCNDIPPSSRRFRGIWVALEPSGQTDG